MSRLTRGIFGRKPTQAGASDITSLDTQYVASVAGTWPSTTSSTEFVAGEAFYTGPGLISYKKHSDGLYYPGLYVDDHPSASYSQFGTVQSFTVSKGGTHIVAAIETAINSSYYNIFVWKKAAPGYTSQWQYVSALTATAASGGPFIVEFHPSGNYLAYGHWGSGYGSGVQKLILMSRSGDSFTTLSNPTDVTANPCNIYCMDWNPDGTSLAVGFSVSPYLAIYNFSNGTLTKLSNPATLPTTVVSCIKWNHDGSSLFVGGTTGKIYNRSGDTFTSIGGLPSFNNSLIRRNGTVSWNQNGTLLASIDSNGALSCWSRSGDSFSGVSVPSVFNNGYTNAGTQVVNQAIFSPSGTELLIGGVNYLEILQVNGTTITRGTTSPFGAYAGPANSYSVTREGYKMGTTYGYDSFVSRDPSQNLRWVPPA